MALAKKTFTLGLDDCKIYPILSDTASEYTVGTGIDVPTVQSINIEFEVDEKELFGDEQVRDMYSKAKKVQWSIECGELDLDVQAALMGGTVTASGSSPNQQQRYGYTLGALNNYVQIAGKISYTDELNDVGDLHIHILKAKVNKNSFSEASDEYGTVSFGGNGINTTYNFPDGRALYYTINETGSELEPVVSE